MIGSKFAGANLSPLRGIKEQENEDISEITYRASAIYLKDEQPEQPIEIVSQEVKPQAIAYKANSVSQQQRMIA